MQQRAHGLVVLGFSLLLAGCGGGANTDDPAAPAAPERRFVSVGTAPAGGAFFVVGGALAEVAGKHTADLGWEVTAEATKGSRENIRRLAQGDLDAALSNAAITYFAVRGTGTWDQEYAVRSVMTLAPNVALFVTPKSSGIERIADLRGKRVVIGPAGAGFEMFVAPLLEAHGLRYEDLTALNQTQAAAVDMLSDGSADAAFLGGAVPTASIVQASASMDLHYIPFDPEARQALIDGFPFYVPATIPSGTYRGLDQDYEGLMVGAMHLITGAATDESLVYSLTKAIYENREEVVERHPAGRAINPKNVVDDRGTPFHPGAERFYREIGIWPQDEATDGEGGAAEDAG